MRCSAPFLICVAVVTVVRAIGVQAQPVSQDSTQQVPSNIAPHAAPIQPIPFSHKAHIGRGARELRCQLCHANPDPGNQMTVAPLSTCMGCHAVTAKDRPAIVTLARLAKAGEAIRWARVYQITPGVTWSHRRHLQGGIQCETCHGQVAQLDAMAQITSVTAMASCISCHQSHNASTACQACHYWPPF